MLDTTAWTTSRRLRPEIIDAIKNDGLALVLPGWSFSEGKTSRSNSFFSKRRITFDHSASGLHVYGSNGRIEGWTASLPHVLHGSNGVQVKNDTEINASLDGVHKLLAELSYPTEVPETLRRLDVAMNIAFDNPEAVLRTFRQNRHPWIRREKEMYATGNICFRGAKVVFQAYWKKPPVKSGVKQKKWHTPGVLRLEVQLKKGDEISEFFGFASPESLRKLPGRRDIYEAFRQFMLGFQRRQYRTDTCTMASLLATCESLGVKLPTGESMMDWHLASAGADAHRKMQPVVSSIMASSSNVDWAELLPQHSIPATVDVYPDTTTRVVPAVPLMRTWPIPRGEQLYAWMSANGDHDLGHDDC